MRAGSYGFGSIKQRGQHLLHPACVHLLRAHLGPLGQGLQQRDVGRQAVDAALGQRALGAAQHIGE
ncbi:hypothetical protein AcdelDRAFT_3807, partial [Acidovorax delafieldii 2AN]